MSINAWLHHPDSLTKRLSEKAGEASLEVLFQGETVPSLREEAILNQQSSKIWRREIVISAHNEPCWYARTIASISTVLQGADFFDELKTKYLGELVFHSPIVERLSLTSYSINATSPEYEWLPEAIRNEEYGERQLRLSHYELRKKYSFYLMEIFLNAVEKY